MCPLPTSTTAPRSDHTEATVEFTPVRRANQARTSTIGWLDVLRGGRGRITGRDSPAVSTRDGRLHKLQCDQQRAVPEGRDRR